MGEWWSYRPGDFLLFSARVYWRLFELQNEALWPWPLVALAVGVLAVVAVLRPSDWRERAVWAVLGLGWVWVAYDFLWLRYQPINWLAEYAAWAFALQGVALAALGLAGRLSLRRRPVGLALLGWAVALHPLLPLVFGRPLAQAEIVGLAPDPTAIATLGLLLASPGRTAMALAAVPVLWLGASWLTLNTMGEAQHRVLLAAIVVWSGGLAMGRARSPSAR